MHYIAKLSVMYICTLIYASVATATVVTSDGPFAQVSS
jgi:hypothetical protein